MSVSSHLEKYLGQANANYDIVHHGFTNNAYDSACSARLPASDVVKAVLLKDQMDGKFVMAAIPASNKVNLTWVNRALNRFLAFASEDDIADQFPDCMPGAVPGMAQAYNLEMIWDNRLMERTDLYFEAGNHEELVHIQKDQFTQLFKHQPHDVISIPKVQYSFYHTDALRG